ncbi:hypothetical protein [Campylobacter concisus]|uniref:hypothetical protein n=1 Tax=Campylobacter concisus TaxID=199 RepID=UPI003D1A9DC0
MRPHSVEYTGYKLQTNNNTIVYSSVPLYNFPYYNTLIDAIQASHNILIELEQKFSIFWLDKAGKICHCSNNIVRIVNKNDLSQLLSSLLGRDIYVFRDKLELENKARKKQLPINDIFLVSALRIVDEYVFTIDDYSGFKNNIFVNNVYSRNIFIRSMYLNTNKRSDIQFSIIIEYLYYISNRNINKFNHIMSWLSNFVKRISMVTDTPTDYPTNNILIFVANEYTGIEILLNKILIPLFGEYNCVEVNDDTISKKDTKEQIKNKILYIIKDISQKTIANKNKKELLEKIICPDDNLFFNNNLKIIITKENYLPYNIKWEYATFKISNRIDDFLPNFGISTIEELETQTFIDVGNFANILRAYILTDYTALTKPKDIDITKKPGLKDSIAKFADELKNDHNLFAKLQELCSEKDYIKIAKLYKRHKKVERKHIYQLFKYRYDYDISATALYKHLAQIDAISFETVKAPGGAKCFVL